MKPKTLSPLGFMMEYIGIQTTALAQALHVDASLISKWKTGNRTLSAHSIYMNEVIAFFLNDETCPVSIVKQALGDMYPHEEITTPNQLEALLRRALTTNTLPLPAMPALSGPGSSSLTALSFTGNSGRREAISQLLSYAETMTTPGDIIFIDSEEYLWLLEDTTYIEQFTQRIMGLLYKGFRAKFVIHYSSYRERFINLFNACSPLIFHRNVDWYYYEYYDELLMNFSFFILNHAVSLLGTSVDKTDSNTIIFTDPSLVIQHENMAKHMIGQCHELFHTFHPSSIEEVVDGIYHFKRHGAFYSYLPSPAFVSAKEYLQREILINNGLAEDEITKYLDLNNKFRKATSCHFLKKEAPTEPFIYIFQLEEMMRRIQEHTFISGSLTLLNGKAVQITKRQYAQELRDLARDLLKYDMMRIIFVSVKDQLPLPSINCWCKQNLWMIQMDDIGFRVSDEISIVNAASILLERCIRKVPPERKNKPSVQQFLLDLAEELEGE